jgi:hypothetical protein
MVDVYTITIPVRESDLLHDQQVPSWANGSFDIKERPDVLVNLRQPNDVLTSLYPEPATTEPEGKVGLLEAFGHCDRLGAKADRVV